MTIEINEKASPSFYTEVINAVSQYRRLMKKPDRKLSNYFKQFRTFTILGIILLGVSLVVGFLQGFDSSVFAAAAMAVVLIIMGLKFENTLNKMLKTFLDDTRTSVFTLDEKGAEINKGDSQIVRIAWENIGFVRAFTESVSFFAKDSTGFIISVPVKYREEIEGYIRDNNISVKTVF